MKGETIRELFRENSHRKWVLVEQGGNQGDQMIYAGARKLADRAGLDYRIISYTRKERPRRILEDEVIYLNGGGGWNTWWNWTPRAAHRLREKNPDNDLIVGPSTVALQGWYLDKWLPEDIVFYAREGTTYDYMKTRLTDVRLDKDTALYLHRDDPYLGELLKCTPREQLRLAAVREDPESPDSLPNIDYASYHVVDPCRTKHWAQLHLYASEIVTNRSHSAILGAILGKPVKMFKGSYHKNRSIWEYSLKQMGVQWIE